MLHKYLTREFDEFAKSADGVNPLMQHIAERIHAHIPRYNWVGFYVLDPGDSNALVLGPHTGSFTPSPRMPLSQGLCGAAFSSRQAIVVDNVAEDSRYVCVSDMVKSQISVPVLAGSKCTGVFSIESYFTATFRPATEREFVESCAGIVGRCAERAGSLSWNGNAGARPASIPAVAGSNQEQGRKTLAAPRFFRA